ncbi:hypothetical protein PVK06_023414 [Gossypium arboreum]|uniref:Uncharacterized protein n=1 Tax=Gossypium arboreum TaxID=29729 RepID=A0ABR0PB83_GOSAR|nr:hypothetical protein PVK06_023414 [Gossypium arboreum]
MPTPNTTPTMVPSGNTGHGPCNDTFGHMNGPTGGPAPHGALMDPSIGPHDFGYYGAARPNNSGHSFGPYSRPNNVDSIVGQNNGPSANFVRLEAIDNILVQNRGVPW